MDYINAAGMFQNQNPVPNNPFWSGYQGGVNQQMAAPFLDMQRQGAGYDLQKKAMETGEFMGPEALAQRSAARRADTANSQYTVDTRPEQGQTEILAQQEKRRAMPDLTEADIQKARQAVMNAKSAPAREFIAELGALGDHFDNVPEEQRQGAYDQFINRWHMTHPGAQLPEHLRKYSPDLHKEMKAIHYASVNTPEQIGKERLTGMQVEGGLNREVLQQSGANFRAGVSANAHIEGAKLHVEAAETPQKAEARLRRELRKDPTNDDARRELSGYLEERFDQKFQRDGLGSMLQVQASSDPAKMQQYLTYREQAKARLFMNEGLYGDIDGEGRNWVLRAIEANPNMGMENIIAEGKRRNKLSKAKKQ